MAQFAVIGLGSFGATIATQLVSLNHDVIGIDSNKKYVESISDQITHAVIADATDEHVLNELNIQNCEAVVVAIGEDIEASILCVLHLKNLGQSQIQSSSHDFDASWGEQNHSSRRRYGRSRCTIPQLPHGQSIYGFRGQSFHCQN